MCDIFFVSRCLGVIFFGGVDYYSLILLFGVYLLLIYIFVKVFLVFFWVCLFFYFFEIKIREKNKVGDRKFCKSRNYYCWKDKKDRNIKLKVLFLLKFSFKKLRIC